MVAFLGHSYFSWFGRPPWPRDPLSFASPVLVLYRWRPQLPDVYMGSGNLNSGSLIYTAVALCTEPSLQS